MFGFDYYLHTGQQISADNGEPQQRRVANVRFDTSERNADPVIFYKVGANF